MSRSPLAKDRETREKERKREKGRRIAFPFPIFPTNFPGYRVSWSPLAPSRSPAIGSTWEGTDKRDYKWYEPAVLQEHKTPNRRPARVLHSWERVLTDTAALFFYREESVGVQRRIHAPGSSWEAWWVIPRQRKVKGWGRPKKPPSEKCRSRSRTRWPDKGRINYRLRIGNSWRLKWIVATKFPLWKMVKICEITVFGNNV